MIGKDVRFRPFDDEDTEWMLQALVGSYQATTSPHRAIASRDTLLATAWDDLKRYHLQARKEEMILLAWSGQDRVGVIWITTDTFKQEEGNAWLLLVYVDARYRKRGLAKDLVRRAEGWAQERGVKEIWLNVGACNEKALGLYSSLGYRLETVHLSKTIVPRS